MVAFYQFNKYVYIKSFMKYLKILCLCNSYFSGPSRSALTAKTLLEPAKQKNLMRNVKSCTRKGETNNNIYLVT